MKRKIYLAGPMSGLPDLNYPAFHAAAAKLRAMGHVVLNPAENPEPACGTWQGYMRMALAQLAQTLGMDLSYFVEAGDSLQAVDSRCREVGRVLLTDWSAA